jgi:hypothetical protein
MTASVRVTIDSTAASATAYTVASPGNTNAAMTTRAAIRSRSVAGICAIKISPATSATGAGSAASSTENERAHNDECRSAASRLVAVVRTQQVRPVYY